jgi:hypothetical protein
MWFCQNEDCLETHIEERSSDARACARCGGELLDIALAERRILPENTRILKKVYRDTSPEAFFVSVVITGDQRASIHKPQWCLPAQGHEIVATRKLDIPRDERDPLAVTVLELRKEASDQPRSAKHQHTAFAYWFVGDDRETASHLRRLYWMAGDRILRGVASRWAYVSVSTQRDPDSDRHTEALTRFIAEFYPLLRPESPEASGGDRENPPS